MTRQTLTLILILTHSLTTYGQDTTKVKLSPYYDAWGIHLDYTYYEANSIGLGVNYLIEPLHKYIFNRQIAYSLDLTLPTILYKDNFIVGQRIDIGINLNCKRLSPDIHVFFEHNDKNDLRVGGKIGLTLANFIYLHYRYSLPIGNYENYNISRHGITLTLKYNRVAVSHLYEP